MDISLVVSVVFPWLLYRIFADCLCVNQLNIPKIVVAIHNYTQILNNYIEADVAMALLFIT